MKVNHVNPKRVKAERVKVDPEEKEKRETLAGYLTEEEVCRKLGITARQLQYLRSDLKLPYLSLNKRVRLYREDNLIEFLENSYQVKEKRKGK